MTTSYDEAVQALYRAPLAKFVEERKRLAAEVAPAEAKLFLKLPRPSVSAWATNQLFWQARPAFDELFETGERLRAGELDATAAHRQATSQLVTRAAGILEEAEHAASEATLRRVGTNLAALAARAISLRIPPGALKSDRDPPGFGALEGMNLAAPRPATAKPVAKDSAAVAAAERQRLAEEEARAARGAHARRGCAACRQSQRRGSKRRPAAPERRAERSRCRAREGTVARRKAPNAHFRACGAEGGNQSDSRRCLRSTATRRACRRAR